MLKHFGSSTLIFTFSVFSLPAFFTFTVYFMNLPVVISLVAFEDMLVSNIGPLPVVTVMVAETALSCTAPVSELLLKYTV